LPDCAQVFFGRQDVAQAETNRASGHGVLLE
jgi:hypothetical protein